MQKESPNESAFFLSKTKPKFLRRNVIIPYMPVINTGPREEVDRLAIVSKLQVKRYYLGKLYAHEPGYRDVFSTDKFFHKISKQTMKCMTHINIPDNVHKKIINILKNSRCLTNIKLRQSKHRDLSYFSGLLKYTGNRLSEFTFNQAGLEKDQAGICRLYRTLSLFPKLKTVTMNIHFIKMPQMAFGFPGLPEKEDTFDLERNLIQKYLRRTSLKEFWIGNWDESKALAVFLREKDTQRYPSVKSIRIMLGEDMLPENLDLTEIRKCEAVTTNDPLSWNEWIAINLNDLKENMRGLLKVIKENDMIESEDNRKEPEGSKQEELVLSDIKKQLVQEFDFGGFPNMKTLNLVFNLKGQWVKKSAFIVGGFATLKNLQRMNLHFEYRPNGTRFIFEEIQNLPLLQTFSLTIPFIKGQEWYHLTQFIQKQHSLTSLRLVISQIDTNNHQQYRELSMGIGNVLKALENTPKLKHLDLHFANIPFNKFAQECLSQGFAQASTGVKQLKYFSFSAKLLPIGFENPSWDHLEGFCKFIQVQKSSLVSLQISLNSFIDAGAAIYISQVFPDLQELTTITLKTNSESFLTIPGNAPDNYFTEICQMENFVDLFRLHNRTWDSLIEHLAKILPKMPKLAELSLNLESFETGSCEESDSTIAELKKSRNPMVHFKIIEILPQLEALKKLNIHLPNLLFQERKDETLHIFLSLVDVNRISISSMDKPRFSLKGGFGGLNLFGNNKEYSEVTAAVEAENAKKFLRTEFQESQSAPMFLPNFFPF